MFRHAFFSFLTLLFFQNIHAQEEVINLENPSFEGRTGAGDVSRHLLIDNASPLVSEGAISDFTKKDSLPSANTEAPKIDFTPLSRKENFFGASFEISVLPKVDSTGQKQDSMARLALEKVLERAVEIEKSVNGDLKKLYAAAKENKGIVPGDDLWFILNFAKEAWERTEGTFEVTMGKLEQLWRENAAEKRKPKPRDIYALQKVSSLEYVRINKEVGGVRLLLPDLPMDVTGLAKGYLLDCLADLFYELGHKQFFIQSEGMAIAGDVPKKLLKWRPVRPYYHWGSKHETNTFIFNSAMVTTEPKEVLMNKYGDTFYSLVDPVSGDVIRHNSIVTVEAASAMHAYAWARALTINYDEDFYQWLESQDTRVWYSEP